MKARGWRTSQIRIRCSAARRKYIRYRKTVQWACLASGECTGDINTAQDVLAEDGGVNGSCLGEIIGVHKCFDEGCGQVVEFVEGEGRRLVDPRILWESDIMLMRGCGSSE